MIVTEYKDRKYTSPIKSVSVRKRTHDYGSFSMPGNGITDKKKNADYTDEDLYILCIRHISDIIDKSFGKPPRETADGLVRFMREQCKKFPVLQRMLSEWICDFCLINGEVSYLGGLFRKGLKRGSLAADFLIGDFLECFPFDDTENTCEKLIYALPYLCDYDYTPSLHFRENTELYNRVLCTAVTCVLSHAVKEKGEDILQSSVRRISRTAYSGLMCDSENAMILEIEYIPYSENTELSALVTSTVKYADNLIRQGLGIKSKIPNVGLAPEYRTPLTEAVRRVAPGLLPIPARAGRKPKSENEKKKRKQYNMDTEEKIQPIDLNIDFSRAKRLEAESWRLAELVGGDYDGAQIDFNTEIYDAAESPKNMPAEKSAADSLKTDGIVEMKDFGEWSKFFAALSEEETKILKCILCGGNVTALSKSLGGMAHGFADSINEKAQDTYGDIVIETSADGGFCVLRDYSDELSEIINDNTEVR